MSSSTSLDSKIEIATKQLQDELLARARADGLLDKLYNKENFHKYMIDHGFNQMNLIDYCVYGEYPNIMSMTPEMCLQFGCKPHKLLPIVYHLRYLRTMDHAQLPCVSPYMFDTWQKREFDEHMVSVNLRMLNMVVIAKYVKCYHYIDAGAVCEFIVGVVNVGMINADLITIEKKAVWVYDIAVGKKYKVNIVNSSRIQFKRCEPLIYQFFADGNNDVNSDNNDVNSGNNNPNSGNNDANSGNSDRNNRINSIIRAYKPTVHYRFAA